MDEQKQEQSAPVIGDFNGDGVVDIKDFDILRRSYGKEIGDPDYNPACDLNGDGVVDALDFAVFRHHWHGI